jgi:hypothetical protein
VLGTADIARRWAQFGPTATPVSLAMEAIQTGRRRPR